ncbi:MAG: hypothetical protein LBS84_13670 [Clostridiales bacterium]|jgi:transposase-like protein|nr:hypothetical protein [Clostridiales bacterium]
MADVAVKRPYCLSEKVIKAGKTPNGTQRYKCENLECSHNYFQLNYTYNGSKPNIKFDILNMAINGSGVRDTARVLGVSRDTVIETLKKRSMEPTSQHKLYKLAREPIKNRY